MLIALDFISLGQNFPSRLSSSSFSFNRLQIIQMENIIGNQFPVDADNKQNLSRPKVRFNEELCGRKWMRGKRRKLIFVFLLFGFFLDENVARATCSGCGGTKGGALETYWPGFNSDWKMSCSFCKKLVLLERISPKLTSAFTTLINFRKWTSTFASWSKSVQVPWIKLAW